MLYIKALRVTGLHELQVLRKAKHSFVTNIPLASHHQSLQCCFKVLINSLGTTKEVRPESLHMRPL